MHLASTSPARTARRTRLDPEQRGTLARLFPNRRYPKNATILRPGEPSAFLFVICRGSIQLSGENDWGQADVIWKSEGDIFGEEVLLGEGSSPYQAMAIEESELCVLDRSDLDELSARAPEILLEIMECVARRLRSVSESLEDQSQRRINDQFLTTSSLENRLADFLVSGGGSWQAFLLFTFALCLWMYLGDHRLLNLILTMMAAAFAPVILLVLKVIQERDLFDLRSRARQQEALQGVDGGLDRNAEHLRDRLAGSTAVLEVENARESQAQCWPDDTSPTPTPAREEEKTQVGA